ncbi:MAG: LexA family protein [Alphaproteobacteria bacterium]
MVQPIQRKFLERALKGAVCNQPIEIITCSGSKRRTDIHCFLTLLPGTRRPIPLMAGNVAAGFPSPADDYLDRPLDLNELLIVNPPATFAARIGSDSMIGAGIFPGDIVIVDRSLSPTDGSIILAMVDGQFTVKRFRSRQGKIWLEAENDTYEDFPITEGMTLEIVGVIHNSIRML